MVQKRPQCFSAKAGARERWKLDAQTKSPRFLLFDLAASRLSCLSGAPCPKPVPQLDGGGRERAAERAPLLTMAGLVELEQPPVCAVSWHPGTCVRQV